MSCDKARCNSVVKKSWKTAGGMGSKGRKGSLNERLRSKPSGHAGSVALPDGRWLAHL